MVHSYAAASSLFSGADSSFLQLKWLQCLWKRCGNEIHGPQIFC